jgi:polyisoprenoid-binding protein YceI
MARGEVDRAGCSAGRLAALALGLALAARAQAEPQRLALDPEASELDFALGATLHTVHGSLRLLGGELALDFERGAISGRVILDATSARTGIEARDRRLHEEVLESGRFPQIVFLPRDLKVLRRAGEEMEAQVTGAVQIRGLEREIAIPLRARIAPDGRVEIEGSFSVPYVRWGLRDVSNLLLRVEPEVEVTLRARGRLAGDQPAALPGRSYQKAPDRPSRPSRPGRLSSSAGSSTSAAATPTRIAMAASRPKLASVCQGESASRPKPAARASEVVTRARPTEHTAVAIASAGEAPPSRPWR